jgi:3-hydroxyisobutyrate dehydrogenase-like beta-hydroxyacid dehydrogenase
LSYAEISNIQLEAKMSDISVIGSGVMGIALASTLTQERFSVTVWNQVIEKTEPLAIADAKVTNSVDQAVWARSA